MKKKNPMLEAFGITREEAYEIEELVDELSEKLRRRDKLIKELKRRFRGGKLLYAIGYEGFVTGYVHALTTEHERLKQEHAELEEQVRKREQRIKELESELKEMEEA